MNDLAFVAHLQAAAAEAAGLKSVEELLRKGKGGRELYICRYRDAAVYLARKHTNLATPRLGQLFGARHHTTILACCRREELRLSRKLRWRRQNMTLAEFHQMLLDSARVKGGEPCVST